MLRHGPILLCSMALLLLLSFLASPPVEASAVHSNLIDNTGHGAALAQSATVSPLASGGGCFNVFSLVRLTSCVSENSALRIVPDGYILPRTADNSKWSACGIYIDLVDDTSGTLYSGAGQNCLAPLRGGYTGHFYGPTVAAVGGHAYHTHVEAYFVYQGSLYGLEADSPEQYA